MHPYFPLQHFQLPVHLALCLSSCKLGIDVAEEYRFDVTEGVKRAVERDERGDKTKTHSDDGFAVYRSAQITESAEIIGPTLCYNVMFSGAQVEQYWVDTHWVAWPISISIGIHGCSCNESWGTSPDDSMRRVCA